MNRLAFYLHLGLMIVLLSGLLLQPQATAYAATAMTVDPLTWNVIGLDSNNVNVGPNHFPVGARVCNTNTAGETLTNIVADFVWDNTPVPNYINLRPGTLSSISVTSLAAGACTDVYFEVEVTRNAAAYDTTRNYHIAVTANGGTVTGSTPMPRTLYVEHLVSQNRNAVTDVQYGTSIAGLTSVPAGGTMTFMVGNTYYIRLIGYTATQGYEQLESFINIPNTIFQVNSVSTTYTADTSATVSSPNDKAYGDACTWENDPNSPNYRSCLSTGKVGGDITVTYQVTILQVPSAPLVNPEPLSTLIYDFSGSSFHYNADYDVSTRFAYIVNASITKSFSPKTIQPGGTSTLTFTINNPGPSALTGVNFSDTLPAGLTLSVNVTTPQCGGTMTGALGTTGPITLIDGTVAGYSTCTVTATVTASTDGTYNNTSDDLFINTSVDTGSYATDTLIVSSKPPAPSSCTTPVTLATWTMPTAGQGSGGPPPPYTTIAADVTTATASAGLTGSGSQSIVGAFDGGIANHWLITDNWPSVSGAPGSGAPYFAFQLDTSNYGGVGITFDVHLSPNGGWASNTNDHAYVYTSANGGAFSLASTTSITKNSWNTVGTTLATTTGTGTTEFRLTFDTASSTGVSVYLDNITFTGCPRPVDPTLSKSFSTSPIAQGGVSTLRFNIANPNTGTALNGIAFTDTLPTGLLIATPNNLSQACTTGTFTGATVTAATGSSTVTVSGGILSAGASCTISVDVFGNVAGSYTNTSGNISSTQTGPNTTSTGYGVASLVVVAPPLIAKAFTANPIFTGNNTTLTFSISNPNTATTLTGVNFSDDLTVGGTQTGLVVATPNGASTTCTGGAVTAVAGSATISLSGASLTAGSSCTVTVNVTGTIIGLKNNSATISSTNGGTGNTDTAEVLVKDPAPAINLLKQVGPTNIGPWTSFLTATIGSNVYYKFTVENTGDVTLTNVSVSDPTVSTVGCSWTQGDSTTPIVSPFTLPVADANNNQIATCIVGPITAASGSHTNTATATGTSGSTVAKSSSATYGTPALTLVKSVTQPSFTSAGAILNYSYLVTNSGFAPLLEPVTVSDDKATVTCPDVSTVGDGDNWFDVGESLTCTATYTIIASDVTAGSVTNTATATADSVNSNTDSQTVYRIPDFTVSKTNDISGSLPQNGTFNWTITVSQISTGQGSFADTQTILSDTLPGTDAYYTLGALTVTLGATAPTGTINCSIVTGPSLSCVASGVVTFPSGSSFSVTFGVTPTAAGSLSNTATVDPNGVITELDETNNASTNVVTVVAPPSIAKAFLPNPIAVGGVSTLTFTITNPNAGTTLTGVAFTDTLPAGLQVAATPNATTTTCGTPTYAPAAGNTSLTFSGGTITASGTCTVTVDVTATMSGAKVNTTGNVTSTNGGTGNTGTDTLNVLTPPSISKAFSPNPITVGGVSTLTFTITNPNAGTALTGVAFNDTFPAGLQVAATPNASTTCGGTFTPAAGNTSVSFSGGTIAESGTCTVTVDVTATTSGAKVNTTGNVTSTNGGTGNTGTDTLTVNNLQADLSITKTDGVITYTPGTSTTYTITASNAGPNDAPGATVADTFPASITATWTCIGAGGGTCTASGTGDINDTVDLPVGGGVTYTVTANISASATGTLSNTATVTAPVGTTDPTPGNNSATDTDTSNPQADLVITKDDGVTTIVPGGSTTYTITASNAGPSAVTGATVADTFPAAITSTSWTCVGAGGGTCTASGTGNINDTMNLPVGGSVTYTVIVNISAAATGTLSNTATVAVPAGTSDPTPGNNSASDTDTVNPVADLAITKTDGVATVNAGGSTIYTITASNAGPSDVTGATVTDTFPVSITTATWTCAGVGGGTCTASGSGNINDTVNLPAGGSVTYTVNATISAAATGTLSNTATVTAPAGTTDPTPGNNSATDTDTLTSTADLSITKTDGVTTYTPGGSVTYTITASNAGLSDVTGATVADTFPASITATWTCAGVGGGTCTASGSGSINDTVNLPAGGSVTYTVTANISAGATGTLINTATVTVPAGSTDPTPGNNSATDTDTSNPQADLAITKDDGVTSVSAGGSTTYTVRVTNNGPSGVTGAVLGDPAVTGLTKTTVACSATPGQCVTAPSIVQLEGGTFALPALASGEFFEITVTADVTAASGSVTNTATVAAPAGTSDPTPGNNSVSDTDTTTLPASISGVVFNDLDLNGTKASGEPGISAVNVYLYDSTGTTVIASTTTNASGAFNFPNLPPGDYIVIETDPSGYVSSTANSVPVTVAAGGSATVNFGDYQLPNTALSTITGTVFDDANGNGVMDAGELPISGVTVNLTNSTGTVIGTTTTNASGGYSFTNLAAGNYTVIETDPTGYVSTTLNNVGVTLSSGSTTTVDFGDQTSGAANIADPAVTKNGSPTSASVGSVVVYSITVGNNGNSGAGNVILTDTKPSFLDIISITISPNPGLTPVISGNTFTINFGTVASTDSYIVTVVTQVNSLGQPPGGTNNAIITTSSTTDRTFNNAAQASLQILSNSNGGSTPSLLPGTGFAPGVITDLSHKPHEAYASTAITLEIPSLGIKIPIMGIPKQDGTWDVTWLSNQAGWLEGTAFPSWSGNSVLTGHVYLSNGLPGPFVYLHNLRYGDQIIIHAYGQKYIFEVSTNQIVPANDVSAFNHEDRPWITLITCREYDQRTNTYKKRVVVRAVLVQVTWDK